MKKIIISCIGGVMLLSCNPSGIDNKDGKATDHEFSKADKNSTQKKGSKLDDKVESS